MIVEERSYALHPGKVPEYMRLYEQEGFAIQGAIRGRLVGRYQTDFGPLNQIVYRWGYESYEDRARRRAQLAANAEWRSFVAKILPLIRRQENEIPLPAPWSTK